VSLVLDASTTLAWCFHDEASPAVDDLMAQIAGEGAKVPSIWRLEVANGLRSGVRRQRLTNLERNLLLSELANLPIDADLETDQQAWTRTLQLADAHGLSDYDASYLELALRISLPLATLDGALRRAGQSAGVMLLPV
jgi:predicted nucleic acid-binding protein